MWRQSYVNRVYNRSGRLLISSSLPLIVTTKFRQLMQTSNQRTTTSWSPYFQAGQAMKEGRKLLTTLWTACDFVYLQPACHRYIFGICSQSFIRSTNFGHLFYMDHPQTSRGRRRRERRRGTPRLCASAGLISLEPFFFTILLKPPFLRH